MATPVLNYGPLGERVISPPLNALSTLRTPLDAAERRVLDLLHAELPVEWQVYIQPHLNGLRPDFVLVHPGQGIAVFEVKDWNESTLREACRPGRENPVDKIDRYKKELYELYLPSLPDRTGFGAITAGLIFPNAPEAMLHRYLDVARARLGHSQRAQYPLVGSESMAAGLPRVFPRAAANTGCRLSPDVLRDLHYWLREPDFQAEQRLQPVLTERQRLLVTGRTESGYRRVRGPAGAGKSLVLAGRAAHLAAEGKKVLVVTYNHTLRNYLKDLAVRFGSGRLRDDVTWLGFHEWVKRACSEAGEGQRYHDFWRSHLQDPHDLDVARIGRTPRLAEALNAQLPSLLEEILVRDAAAVTHYDAILVDEGQDFQPHWWSLLRRICRPGGEMILVADATQDIYGNAARWTDQAMTGAGFRGEWVTLEHSHRLPARLAALASDFAQRFLPAGLRMLPTPPQGELALEPTELRWVQVSDEALVQTTLSEVRSQISSSTHIGGAVADLTILTDSSNIGERVVRNLESLGVRVIHTFGAGPDARRRKRVFFMGDARVKVTTLHSFKGWETTSLLVCVQRGRSATDLAGVYAAITRLRRSPEGGKLTVVCAASELATYGATWDRPGQRGVAALVGSDRNPSSSRT
jgi:hypothetical protein